MLTMKQARKQFRLEYPLEYDSEGKPIPRPITFRVWARKKFGAGMRCSEKLNRILQGAK